MERTQSAFSRNGLPIGGNGRLRKRKQKSDWNNLFNLRKGTKIPKIEGYITEIGLDENDQIIGYKYVNIGKMMQNIKAGIEPMEAIEKASGKYGRFDEINENRSKKRIK